MGPGANEQKDLSSQEAVRGQTSSFGGSQQVLSSLTLGYSRRHLSVCSPLRGKSCQESSFCWDLPLRSFIIDSRLGHSKWTTSPYMEQQTRSLQRLGDDKLHLPVFFCDQWWKWQSGQWIPKSLSRCPRSRLFVMPVYLSPYNRWNCQCYGGFDSFDKCCPIVECPFPFIFSVSQCWCILAVQPLNASVRYQMFYVYFNGLW